MRGPPLALCSFSGLAGRATHGVRTIGAVVRTSSTSRGTPPVRSALEHVLDAVGTTTSKTTGGAPARCVPESCRCAHDAANAETWPTIRH